MKNRSENLDALKGLAILLVMIGHCIVLNGMEDGILYDGIKAVQMSLFMGISGYIVGFGGKITSAAKAGNQIRKRAVHYLIPFFSWIVLLHVQKLPGVIWEFLNELDKGLWFLMTLFLLSAVMYLSLFVRDCTRGGKPGFLGVWFFFGILLLFQSYEKNNLLSPHLTIQYMPFYFGGFLLYRWKEEKEKKQESFTLSQKQTGILLLFLFFLFSFLIVRYDMVTAHTKAELFMQPLASATGCFICILLISELPWKKGKAFLSKIGAYTLEIYVLHYHFARILGVPKGSLSLYSIKGILFLSATFFIMSGLTALLIILIRKVSVLDLLLFGNSKKKHKSETL